MKLGTGARPEVTELLHSLGFTSVAGVFVGGCVERGVGSAFRAAAHTHDGRAATDPFERWICVRSTTRVLTGPGRPTRLLRHEVAHTIAPTAGHGSAAFVAALATAGIRTDSYSRAGRVRAGKLR